MREELQKHNEGVSSREGKRWSHCGATVRVDFHKLMPMGGVMGKSALHRAAITILQVLTALVASRVSRGVSHQAPPLRQQLLLGAREATPFRITAA